MISIKESVKKYIVPITAIIGIITTIKLTLIFINANFVINAQPSFCTINETIDCDAVAKSAFSSFLGVPNSIWGLFFYLFVITVYFADKLKEIALFKFMEVFKNPNSYIFCLSLISIVVSIGLAWISSHVIHKICILCYLTYFLNFILLLATKNGETIFEHIKKSLTDFKNAFCNTAYASSAIILAILASLILVFTNTTHIFIPKAHSAFQQEMEKFQINNHKVSGNVLGDKNAIVYFHEYTDFQCPYCAIANSMLHRLVSEVSGVQVMHHNFPLDKSCNPIMKNEGHKNSCLIARYSLAAKLQNKELDFNTIIFENNQNLTEAKTLEFAKSVGIDVEQLKKDANSKEIKEKLSAEVNKGNKLGITSTPTFRIGVKLYEGLMPYQELKSIVINNGAKPKR